MATATPGLQPVEESRDKGLKTGALGLVSSVVMGVASTAPAYSLAATLFFVFALVGLHSPAVAVLAFVPIFLCSIGYSELNKADPDCGTTFTWASRAFGPKTGWAGGWGIVAADVLVMASLAQVAGQYFFFLIQGPNSSIGANASGGWVLLVGVIWIILMTYICYRGIEVSANFQKALLSIEIVMLLVMSVTALVKVYASHPGREAIPASFARIHPKHLTPTVSTIVMGVISIALYIPLNYLSGGNPIADAVTAIGLYIAFYYGLTGFACVWYYRRTLTSSARNLWMRGILPGLGGLLMYAAGIYALQSDWVATTGYTFWTVPGLHWEIGGIFIIAVLAALAGILGFVYMRVTAPAFFRKETLTRATPTLVPDE